MAKTTGPLMSMDARGKFGKTFVFIGWKGRSTVRRLVTPANPMSTDQVAARNKQRVTAAAQHWANVATTKGDSRSQTDKDLLIAAAPSGFAWNGNLVKAMIGSGGVNYAAAEAAWTALGSTPQGDWNTAAAALTPVFGAVAQFTAGNVLGTPYTGGHAFFIYQYGLYILEIAAEPSDTPPTYA